MEGKVTHVTAITKGAGCDKPEDVEKKLNTWTNLYSKDATVEDRNKNYMPLVNQFYDLVTTFYEFGWGQSFHFAPRRNWESFEASIYRHEFYLAHRLELTKGKKVIDVGCGVGGPARNIANFSEAQVVGLNNNSYQLTRARKHAQDGGVSDLVSFIQNDFMKMDVENESFDAAYSIESTCHAPDKVGVYSEIYRVLKPGALYGSYEWVMTDKFEPDNAAHVQIKEGIEKGNGVPDLQQPGKIIAALKEAGFEVIEYKDMAYKADPSYPWFLPLSGSFSLAGWKHTRIGRYFTNRAVALLETIKIAPKGTTEVSNLLMATADDLVNGGRQEIFTPMLFFLVRKPLGDQ
eukprot:TRINITY_DN17865_c0_g1_i1.p1 TRINITY_DN17865_c0_g1~~TRINITY_DN17865_c0_g1_i1.p1  ORF type:complete len:383 (-),score=100.18 TRINITY_DN17865_c0_g1_i1:29-1069(-)